jgi:crossover junction endodeoxyribonuclease RusA
VKGRAAKKARTDAQTACLATGARGLNWGAVHADILFCAPDARRRDLDNLLASIKSALDGIADTIKIDDSKWQIAMRKDPIVWNDCKVVVTLTEAAA